MMTAVSLSLTKVSMTLFSHKCISVAAICCVLTGCAQSKFHASELPVRYAAAPVRDFSQLDLAHLATLAPDAATILPGDRLRVTLDPGTLTEDSEHIWKVSVGDSGEAALPNIGSVRLAGLTRTEAEQAITQTSRQRDVFLTPTVEVAVEDRREQTIQVTGAVGKPGIIVMRTGELRLADVLVRAGGLTGDASGIISVSAATLRQLTPQGQENLIKSASASASVPAAQAMTISLETTPLDDVGQLVIPAGAVVTVEKHPPRPIKVTGVIKNQSVEVPAGQNVRLLDALTLSGGPTYSNWISDRVTVIRTDPNTNEVVRIGASIRRARKNGKENLLLAPHDIVNVEENVFTFTLSTISGFLGAGFNASRLAL